METFSVVIFHSFDAFIIRAQRCHTLLSLCDTHATEMANNMGTYAVVLPFQFQ